MWDASSRVERVTEPRDGGKNGTRSFNHRIHADIPLTRLRTWHFVTSAVGVGVASSNNWWVRKWSTLALDVLPICKRPQR